MCEVVEWKPVLPKPSGDLPCNALPFGILQDVCRALDVDSGLGRGWKEVAELWWEIDLECISYINRRSVCPHSRRPTVLFLDSLWEKRKVTVQAFLNRVRSAALFPAMCKRLEDYLAEKIDKAECIESSHSSTLVEETRSQVRTFFSVIPTPTVHSLERTGIVTEIFEHFRTSRRDTKLCTMVAEGDPGLGKSQIARQVGQKFIDYYASRRQDVAVVTIMAGDKGELLNSYKNLAGLLGGNVENILMSNMSEEEILSVLFDHVGSRLSEYPNWLLIVDNLMNRVDSREGQKIYPYIPYASNEGSVWSNGCVLLTIQLRGEFSDLDVKIVGQKQLRPSFSEAKQLIQNVLTFDIPEDDCTLQGIVEALGYNSLALVAMATAINFIRGNIRKYKWTDYEKELHQVHRVELAKRKQDTEPSISVSTSVGLALSRLANRRILQLVFVAMSLLQYKSVPLALIKEFIRVKLGQTHAKIKLQLQRLVSTLDQYPLITRSTTESSVSGGKKAVTLCHVHQVTHTVLKSDMVQQWGTKLSFTFPLLRAALVCENSQSEETTWELPYLVPQLYTLGENSIELYHGTTDQENDDESDLHTAEEDWKDLPEVLYKAVTHASFVLQSTSTRLKFIEQSLNVPSPLERKMKYLFLKGVIYETKGEVGVAIDVGRNALMLAKLIDSIEPNPKLVADAVLVQRVRRVYQEGIAMYRQHMGYFLCEGSYGKESKEYAMMLYMYADVVKRVDRAEARAALEESIHILRTLDEQLTLGDALCYFGRFLLTSWSSSDLRLALETAREGLAIAEQVAGKESITYINRNLTLGRALMVNLNPSEAIEQLQPLLPQVKATGGVGQFFNYQFILAMCCAMSMRLTECRKYLEGNTEIMIGNDIGAPPITRKSVSIGLGLLHGIDCLVRRPLSWLCSTRHRNQDRNDE